MDGRNTLACFLFFIGSFLILMNNNLSLTVFDFFPIFFCSAISICDAQGDSQRDSFRPHRPPQPLTTQTPIPPQSTIQVLGIPIVPALNLAGGIVGSVLVATRPREPPFAPFSCLGRVPGYYADITTNCKVISQIVTFVDKEVKSIYDTLK
jgi:hypothetical protein